MSQLIIAGSSAAGNASDATFFTMPSGYAGFISAIIGTNTTGGGLTLTVKVYRTGTLYTILSANTINANTATSYNKGTTSCIVPIFLNAGDYVTANGSGSGINVTFGGLRFTV